MAVDALIGREVAGYRIEALIGRGGMGVVYRAEHLLLGRRDALKILAAELAEDAGFRERFLRESRLAAAIEHPNIIPIYHAGDAEGLLYIAMRYVEGTDLRALLKREGPLAPRRAIEMLGQVGSALDLAHASGLVHRDVKPANILIAEQGRVYLSDFGIAKQTATRGLTKTGSFVGTLDYAAPEQIEGRDLDGRADVYSLACVLCECLTGAVPYQKDSEVQLLYAHLLEPPPALTDRRPELGPDVDTVVAKALAKSRDDRYGSCRELLDALSFAVEREPSPSPVRPAADATKAAPRPPGPPVVEREPVTPPAAPQPVSTEPWTPPPENTPSAPYVPPVPVPVQVPAPAPAAERRGPGRNVILVAAAALLAVAAFAAVLLTRGSHGAHAVAVDRLLARVPMSVRRHCRSRSGLPVGATAGVLCAGGTAETVAYYSFPSAAALNRYFASQARRGGIQSASGNCADLPFRGERPYTIRGRETGRLFCGTLASEAVAFVAWSDRPTRIYARATRADGNNAALARWWSNGGGLVATGASKVARRSASLASGTVVYSDTFSSSATGWPTRRDAATVIGYSGGSYRILIHKTNQLVPSTTADRDVPLSFRNVEVQVNVRRMAAAGGYSAGVVCLFDETAGGATFYALQVRNDGLLRIRKVVGATVVNLAQRDLGHAVAAGRLSARCGGGEARPVFLSLSLNGGPPLTFRDRSRFSSGAVGVLAQSFRQSGVAIQFDNFRVSALR